MASVKHESPDVSQNVIIISGDEKGQPNSNKGPSAAIASALREPKAELVSEAPNDGQNMMPERQDEKVDYSENNPYVGCNDSSQTVDERYNALLGQITEKDNVAQALLLILNVIENNPLTINKYAIAELDVLKELIRLLTSSDEVSIELAEVDVSCNCCGNSYAPVEKIYVTKDGDTKVLKYSYPETIKLLDEHRISYKFVVVQ